MILRINNDTGTEIGVDVDTVDKVEDVNCEEHCVIHIGVVPIRVEGDAKKLANKIAKMRGNSCVLVPFKKPGGLPPKKGVDPGLPTAAGEDIPPPSDEDETGHGDRERAEGAA